MKLRFALLVCLGFAAAGVRAEDPAAKESDVPPYSMPTEELFTDDELHQFEYRKSVPYGDASLTVLLPCRVGWKWVEVKSDTKASSDRMVPLARVEAPEDKEVAIEIKYLVLPREVKLDDWVDWFVDLQGMFVVAGQVGEYHGRRVVDAVAEYKVKDERVFVTRVGFFKTGNRIYMIAGSAPKDKYETYAKEFGLAVTSGTPETLEGTDFAEGMTEYMFPAGKRWKILYPASWKMREASDAPEGVNAVDLFHEDPAKPVGLIKVRIFDKERAEGGAELDFDKVSWSVFEEMKSAMPKLELRDKTSELEAGSDRFEGHGRLVVYSAMLDGTAAEIHELILEAEDAWFSVHLVTPPREKAPWLWMVNHRAWEIVGNRVVRKP